MSYRSKRRRLWRGSLTHCRLTHHYATADYSTTSETTSGLELGTSHVQAFSTPAPWSAAESYKDISGISMKGVRISGKAALPRHAGHLSGRSRVLNSMLPYYFSRFGNPHSRTHHYGSESDQARAQVAAIINSFPKEIVCTSGDTESNNISVKGVMHFYKDKRDKRHVVTTQTEHVFSIRAGIYSGRTSTSPASPSAPTVSSMSMSSVRLFDPTRRLSRSWQ